VKKLPLTLVSLVSVSIGLSVGVSGFTPLPVHGQVTKFCQVTPIDGVSTKVKIDPKSEKPPEGRGYVAFSYKIPSGFRYYTFVDQGKTVSMTDVTFQKDKKGGKQVRVRVCGEAQFNAEIPYLNLKFGNKVIRVKALGTANNVHSVPTHALTSSIQTKIEPH
jgi:hypothetical protein